MEARHGEAGRGFRGIARRCIGLAVGALFGFTANTGCNWALSLFEAIVKFPPKELVHLQLARPRCSSRIGAQGKLPTSAHQNLHFRHQFLDAEWFR